jgi:peroxiredoxin
MRTPALLAATALAASPLALADDGYTTPEPPGLAVGDAAPEVSFQSIEGEAVTLASLHEDRPVIVTFYRGRWCPFCTKDLAGWQERLDDIESAGAQFVAVTFEQPRYITQVKKEHDLSYTVLADPSGDAARALKILFYVDEDVRDTYKNRYGLDLEKLNATGDWSLPAPATFLIDTDGTIAYQFADWDYSKRADPDEVLAAARRLDAD